MYRFQEPNKPTRAGEGFLDAIDGESIVDTKIDGWRTEIGKFNGKLHFYSRKNKVQNVTSEWYEIFSEIIPEGCELDVEWINPSRIKAINTHLGVNLPLLNMMSVFDVRWYDNKYLLRVPIEQRRKLPIYSNLPTVKVEEIISTEHKVFKTPSVSGLSAKDFYRLQANHAISEGIVIKRLNEGLNGNWFKVKYRK